MRRLDWYLGGLAVVFLAAAVVAILLFRASNIRERKATERLKLATDHPQIVKHDVEVRWRTRTVVGPERIREVVKYTYLPSGTTEEYHERTTTKAQLEVKTSSSSASVEVSSGAASVLEAAAKPPPSPSRLHGWALFVGWHRGSAVGGLHVLPGDTPIMGSIGVASPASAYLSVGYRFH